jgi:hypothetical protein
MRTWASCLAAFRSTMAECKSLEKRQRQRPGAVPLPKPFALFHLGRPACVLKATVTDVHAVSDT